MMQIIWGVLNIAIFVYFIIICFKLARIIREKLGLFATVVFVLGLCSFMAGPDNQNIETKRFNLRSTGTAKTVFQGNTYSTEVQLENDLVNEISLLILYGENQTGKTLFSATASRSGFVSGTTWSAESVNVYKTAKGNACRYDVSGFLEWNILGITIYKEMKYYSGKTALKN